MKKSFYSLSKKVLSFARFPKSSKFKKRNSFLENENHACFALFSQKSCTITGFFRNFLKRLICAGKGHLFGHLNLAEKSEAKLKFEATFLNAKNFIESNLRFSFVLPFSAKFNWPKNWSPTANRLTCHKPTFNLIKMKNKQFSKLTYFRRFFKVQF